MSHFSLYKVTSSHYYNIFNITWFQMCITIINITVLCTFDSTTEIRLQLENDQGQLVVS